MVANIEDMRQYFAPDGSPVMTQAQYDVWLGQEEARLNREHNVITSIKELRGWDIVQLIRWKPGVVRFHAQKGKDFQSGFAKDEVFAHLQLPATSQQ